MEKKPSNSDIFLKILTFFLTSGITVRILWKKTKKQKTRFVYYIFLRIHGLVPVQDHIDIWLIEVPVTTPCQSTKFSSEERDLSLVLKKNPKRNSFLV